MRKIKKILFLLGMVFPMMVLGQTNVDLDPEFGGRMSFAFDKKITKGFHFTLEEELRFDNNFSSFDRIQSTLFLNYKIDKNIKVGLGYALINGYSASNGFKDPRHRFLLDVKGTLKLGLWNLSLKERLQMTHRTGNFNVYQNPRNAFTLKSRLTAKYLGFRKFEPYAYFELRNYLNAPVISAAYDGFHYLTLDDFSETGDAGWFLTGFNGGYINRYRGSIGTDIKLNKHNTLNFYLLFDYVIDKEVDASADGTRLKSYTKESGFKGWFGAAYEFSF